MKDFLKTGTNIICIIPFLFLLSTPFVVEGALINGVVSGKYFWFYKGMEVSSLAVILSFLINRRKIRFSIMDFFIVAFCLSAGIITFRINGEITTKLISLFLLTVCYFYFRLILSQWSWNMYILTCFFMLTGWIEAVWGIRQLYGYSLSFHSLFRTTGSFFNPGPYAGYLAFVFPMAVYYLISDYPYIAKKKLFKRNWPFFLRWSLATGTCISMLLILPATMSRASWISAVCGSIISGCFFIFRKYDFYHFYKAHGKKIIGGLLIGACLFIVAGSSIYYLKKDSADGRMFMWKITLPVIYHHPMGVGLGNFSGAYGNQQATYFASGKGTIQEENIAGNPEYAFNEYLQICVETGMVSFLFFVVILIMTIRKACRRKLIALAGALISLLVFAAMSYPFRVLPFLIAFCFLLAASNMEKIRRNGSLQKQDKLRISSLLVICFIITSYCLVNRYPVYTAYLQWSRARVFYQAEIYDVAEEKYEALYPFLNDQIDYLFEYAQSLSKNGKYEVSNQVLTKVSGMSADPMIYNIMGKNYQQLNNYYLAEQNFIKASHIVPHRLYPYYLLVNFYRETGNEEKAREVAEYLLKKKPKIDSPAVREIKKEMKEYLENYSSL